RLSALQERKSWPPHERAIAEHPEVLGGVSGIRIHGARLYRLHGQLSCLLSGGRPCIWLPPKRRNPRLGMARGRLPRPAATPVVRFRSSPALAVRSEASFGIQDHWQLYDSSAPLNPKFAFGLAARYARTSGSGH